MWMPGTRGRQSNGTILLRAVERALPAVPKTIQKAYSRHEIVNSVFVHLKSKGVHTPSRLQVRNSAIDMHRANTRYRRGKKHGDQFTNVTIPDRPGCQTADTKIQIADHLTDVRRRFGSDGLCIFLLSRIMEFKPTTINRIMDFNPNSLMAKSISDIVETASNGH